MSEAEGTATEPDSVRRERRRSSRWRTALRDLVVVVAWVGLVTFAFGILRWPSWAYYLVVFGGIVLYSLVGDPWASSGS